MTSWDVKIAAVTATEWQRCVKTVTFKIGRSCFVTDFTKPMNKPEILSIFKPMACIPKTEAYLQS